MAEGISVVLKEATANLKPSFTVEFPGGLLKIHAQAPLCKDFRSINNRPVATMAVFLFSPKLFYSIELSIKITTKIVIQNSRAITTCSYTLQIFVMVKL